MGGPHRFTVATRGRRVEIEAAPDESVRVEGGTARPQSDGSIEIRSDGSGAKTIRLRCPSGSHVSVGTQTGRVATAGSLGDVRVVTQTGKITIDRAERVDVRTITGSVEVGTCVGECRLVTASARVEVGWAGSIEIASTSGRVEAGAVRGGKVRTVSGSIRIALGGPGAGAPDVGALRVASTSGGVEITVPQGAHPAARLRSVSGRITNRVGDRDAVAAEADGSIEVRTTSGSIRVERR